MMNDDILAMGLFDTFQWAHETLGNSILNGYNSYHAYMYFTKPGFRNRVPKIYSCKRYQL